jgi:TonB family protein
MPRLFKLAAVVLFSTALIVIAQQAPAPAPNAERKITTRIQPDYPELARRMHLQGIVKVEAVVRPNGSVKSTRALGGNPVLVDAALNAVGKWKFEPAQSETTEVLQLTFTAQ